MFKEIIQTKSVEEIKILFSEKSEAVFFSEEEFRSVEKKNKIKSLGARYLIKNSILDYLAIENNYKDIEIVNQSSGKPIIKFAGNVQGKLNELNISNVQISISHSRNFISSIVILEQDV